MTSGTTPKGHGMPINKYDLFLSIRRTVVPITVGAVSASVLAPWLPAALVAEWATLVLASVYYIVLRVLEVKVPGRTLRMIMLLRDHAGR
jgi:hypothetical protein